MRNITATNFNGDYRAARVSEKTYRKVRDAERRGKTIYINSNYRAPARYPDAEKLCQTNNRYNGLPKHVIWAV